MNNKKFITKKEKLEDLETKWNTRAIMLGIALTNMDKEKDHILYNNVLRKVNLMNEFIKDIEGLLK
jgi:hypothetical protein